jgi:hypothetical protein
MIFFPFSCALWLLSNLLKKINRLFFFFCLMWNKNLNIVVNYKIPKFHNLSSRVDIAILTKYSKERGVRE